MEPFRIPTTDPRPAIESNDCGLSGRSVRIPGFGPLDVSPGVALRDRHLSGMGHRAASGELMKRNLLHLTIGLGSVLAELGGIIAQIGVEVEHWGLERLAGDQHPIYQPNDPNDEPVTTTTGNGYRVSFLK